MSLDRPSRSLRVLIVEDESRLRDLLLDVIPDLGFPASAARSAEEAMRIMESDPHDILLLDLQLPLMGGMDFFEKARARWPAAQVIILTGFGDMEAARLAIHLDVVDFLSKPFHLSTIEVALERARRRHASNNRSATPEAGSEVLRRAGPNTDNTPSLQPPTPEPEDITLAESERRHILAALERNHGNRTATAAELGISRRTLHYRLSQYRKSPGET